MRLVATLATPEPAQLDALVALLRGRVLSFVVWLVEIVACVPFGAELHRQFDFQLRRAAAHVEHIVFLHAAWRLRFVQPRRRTFHAMPSGFRSTRSFARNRRRLMHIAGLNAGAPIERAHRLLRVLANLSAMIARAVRRLRRGRHGAVLNAAAPPAHEFASHAQPALVVSADTS